ncbi:MAG: YfhO family protein, partial [Ginsengibacter sp.]
GFAFWNPVTWIWGSLFTYNAFSLTAEVLFYIYLGGVTTYYLGRYFKFSFTISILIASMYMCSGFFADSLQYINFLTAAAFLPFLLMCFLALQTNPNFRSSFLCAIAGYLIAASGHPAIPVATLYFLLAIFILILAYKLNYPGWKRLVFYNFIALFLFVLFFLPAIYSYVQVLPYYHIPLETADNKIASFSFSSFISLVFPFSTASITPFFQNDLAMRNVYFSIAGILAVIIAFKSRSKMVKALLVTALFMVVLSLGGDIKTNFYSSFPLLRTIRTNGEFRVFALLCLTVVAGFGLDQLLKKEFFPTTWQWLLKALVVIALIGIGYAICFGNILSILKNILDLPIPEKAKYIYGHSSFSFYLLISAAITLFFSTALVFIKKTTSNWFAIIILGDLIINSIIFLPVTGVGQVTVGEIQKMYDQNPKGFPIPPLKSLNDMESYNDRMSGLLGDKSFYDKEIGIKDLTTYPSYFKSTDAYLNSSIIEKVQLQPFVFLLSDLNDRAEKRDITINDFSPNKINLTLRSNHPDTLIFLQNYFPLWTARINDREVKIQKKLISFMAVPVEVGINKVEFQYKDHFLWLLMAISLCSFSACLIRIFVIRTELREKRRSVFFRFIK